MKAKTLGVFFSLYYFLSSPHLFFLTFFLSNFSPPFGHRVQTDRSPHPQCTHESTSHRNPGLPPRAGTEQSLAQISGVPESVRARRHLGDQVTQEEQTLLSSRQECGIHEQKRVRPTAESVLHADSADATHLHTSITIQNCGIGVARAPNLLLFLRES